MTAKKAPAIHSADSFTDTSVALTLPTNAVEVARLQKEAEADSAFIRTVTVTDADTYQAADELLTGVVRLKDAAKAMCQSATLPLYGVIRTVEGWFRPYSTVLTGDEAYIKAQLGAYRLALAAKERAASAAANAAAKSGDAPKLLEALATVQEAQAKPEGKASVRFVWVVKRIIEDALPDEYWTPDLAEIANAVKAQGYTGDEPPFVRGVVFEREVQVGAKR